MSARLVEKEDQYYFNYCSKYLARGPRGSGGAPNTSQPSEAWRFPLIDTGPSSETNSVSFILDVERFADKSLLRGEPRVIGTFANLFEPIPMRRLRFLGEDSAYYALSVEVPKGEVHRYQLEAGGSYFLDPVNPQQETIDDGSRWSRFFTEETHRPIVLERWQLSLIARLTDHLLPFRTEAAANFLNRFYQSGTAAEKANVHRLDESVGEVSYIDKVLAREELHHLEGYRIALRQIDSVLRQRNPFVPPEDQTDKEFTALYDEMAANAVPGWDTNAYESPRYFLQLLRRHATTGAFSHPKHGGNVGAAGWAYLAEKYESSAGGTAFDWRPAIEPPLGNSEDYRG